jgi:imidazolonepropionase-like amidohydrolase
LIARLLACLTLLIAASPAAAQQPAAAPTPQTIVIHAGRLIAEPGRAAQGPSTITVAGGRILSVTSGLQPAPAGARLVDLSQRTVLPGLIDTHTHCSMSPARISATRRW